MNITKTLAGAGFIAIALSQSAFAQNASVAPQQGTVVGTPSGGRGLDMERMRNIHDNFAKIQQGDAYKNMQESLRKQREGWENSPDAKARHDAYEERKKQIIAERAGAYKANLDAIVSKNAANNQLGTSAPAAVPLPPGVQLPQGFQLPQGGQGGQPAPQVEQAPQQPAQPAKKLFGIF